MRGDGTRVPGRAGGIVVDDGGRPVTDDGGRPVLHGPTPGSYVLDDQGTPPVGDVTATGTASPPYDADPDSEVPGE